jgi:uncharacterized membrane protein
MSESRLRSVLKAISWRILASVITGTLVYLFTGKGELAVGVGLLDSAVKIIVYYFHERLWQVIPIGRKKHPLEDIEVRGPIEDEDKEKIREVLKDLGYLD